MNLNPYWDTVQLVGSMIHDFSLKPLWSNVARLESVILHPLMFTFPWYRWVGKTEQSPKLKSGPKVQRGDVDRDQNSHAYFEL